MFVPIMGEGQKNDNLLKTFSYRVKDSSSRRHLRAMARSVSFVWNYCNDVSRRSAERGETWADKRLLFGLTKGASKDLNISSQTVQAVCQEFVIRRRQVGKPKLRWRGRRSLGWVPFKNQTFEIDGKAALYAGHRFYLWLHRPIEGRIKCGSFSEDARGRWYCNVVCEIERPAVPVNRDRVVGMDLGFKTAAKAFNAPDIEQARFYRDLEPKLAEAQRRRRKRQVRSIHAKIGNRRKDFLHKYSRTVINSAGAVFVGNISSQWQIRSGKAKATLDMSWSMLRGFLKYKCDHAGVVYADIDERYTTQACSECGSLGGPKGREGLGIRQWVCGDCGTIHDRDFNAAMNIARLGCKTLGLKWPGSPVL